VHPPLAGRGSERLAFPYCIDCRGPAEEELIREALTEIHEEDTHDAKM